MRVCSSSRNGPLGAQEIATQVEVTSLLIQHGACVSEVAVHFHTLSVKRRSRCPVELMNMLGPARQVPENYVVADPLEDKLTRANERYATKLRNQRYRAHLTPKCTQKRMVRPRGGKRKCGFVEVEHS